MGKCDLEKNGIALFFYLQTMSHSTLTHFSYVWTADSSVLFCQQYNGVSMKNKTKEEAYLELLKPAETVTFKVQNCVDELAAISQIPGDGFFIRYTK